ncbi:MAG: thioredoxin domain-containing protein, partial [Thermodesulfobacteriota bacterium]
IIVDREERPDIDNVYMNVCQILSKQGCGWPLTIIMTPDKKPFFAATYLPKNSRFGQPGLIELIPKVKKLWENNQEELLNSADKITEALKQSSNTTDSGGKIPDNSTLELAFNQLSSSYDSKHGGFGSSPKFPSPHNLLFLLRYWNRSGNKNALNMVEKTLQEMHLGGIYDHVGFGFHRYSTDADWHVPHFEKMIYDQAMLALAYTEAYQATGNEEYKETVKEIINYVLRDMTDPKGGFYAAEDADSEGQEGMFYFWTMDKINKVLEGSTKDLFISIFNIKKEGNFQEKTGTGHSGENILYMDKPLEVSASQLNMSEKELRARIEEAREKLFKIRERRIHPGKDGKVLTDWNGLMIAALAEAGRVFNDHEYTDAAKKAADFILDNMRTPDGALLHSYKNGKAGVKGKIDDYTFLTWGLLELYETDFDIKYLKAALDLNEKSIKNFWDEKDGGFYFTAADDENLLVRDKVIYDGAITSGNSIAMMNLLRLGRITAKTEFDKKVATMQKAFSKQLSSAPAAFTQAMSALDFALGPSYEVVIVGDPDAQDIKSMLKALNNQYIPNKVVILRPLGDSPEITSLAKFTAGQISISGKATAYVCENYACNLPTTNITKMLEELNVKESVKMKGSN